MTVPFNLTLTEDDWNSDVNGWRCSVFSILGARVIKILVNGEEDDLQNYRINPYWSMIYWDSSHNPNCNKPDQITVLITFDDPQLSSSEQTKKWKRIATIATPIGLLVTAIISALLTWVIFSITSKPTNPEAINPKATNPEAINPTTPETLEKVRTEGTLKCGINGKFPGFSWIGNKNQYVKGFEADYCRVIAAAIFGQEIDSTGDLNKIREQLDTKIDFVPVPLNLNEPDRFEYVVSGKIDVLIQHASWTTGRDLKYDIEFGTPIFYDEQLILAKKSSGIQYLKDLKSLTGTEQKLCVSQETTSETNITNYLKDNNIVDNDNNIDDLLKIQKSHKNDGTNTFFDNFKQDDSCAAITADSSQILTQFHGNIDEQDSEFQLVKLKKSIAQEILSPVFIEGDPEWRDVINYSIYATIRAAGLGISQSGISNLIENKNSVLSSEMKQLLGIDDSDISEHIGEKLNLDQEFAQNIIQLVGNYYDIFGQNLVKYYYSNDFYEEYKQDPSLPCLSYKDEARVKGFKNQLWTCGGILISPPFTMKQKLNQTQ